MAAKQKTSIMLINGSPGSGKTETTQLVFIGRDLVGQKESILRRLHDCEV
ncbi:MAG: hypothetical protein WCA08_16550 [Desulfoferrobacter sp.]